MRRIGLTVMLAVSFVFAPLDNEGQQTRKIQRVGVLGGQSAEISPPILALREGLRDLGYVEGQNIAIEWRWAHGKNERYAEMVAAGGDWASSGPEPSRRKPG